MRLVFILMACVISSFLTGCKKESSNVINCEQLRLGLQTNNIQMVEKEINAISDFKSADNIELLYRFCDTLQKSCGLATNLLCYNCIYTNPPQSEIQISFSVSGITKNKIIDLIYVKDHLQFSGMHE